MPERQTKPMISTIAATEARIHFGDVLKRVHNKREHLIVEKDGLPIAAILSHADYEEYRLFLARQLLEEMNKTLNREAVAQGYTEEQALEDLATIKKEVYQKRYGRAVKPRRKKTT
jgi:prevent-host-death family protein